VADGDGITVYAVPMARRISIRRDLSALANLVALLRRIKPHIVHASTAKAGVLGTLAAKLARVPVKFYTARGLVSEIGSASQRRLLWVMECITCSLANQVLAVSQSVADGLVRRRLCRKDKIRIIRRGSSNGVEAEKLFDPARVDESRVEALRLKERIDSDSLVIGFVGRVSRDKGIAELAEAWEIVRTRSQKALLLIVGPVDKGDSPPNSVLAKLGADARVIMTDEVDSSLMPLYYRLMDVVVLPSYREGFHNVLLEAAAMQLPVVAARVTGCVDAVVNGVTGTLVAPRESEALANAIETYLDNPDLRISHGRAGRERVLRDFRPEPIWEAISEEYARWVTERGLTVPQPLAESETLLTQDALGGRDR
jgi:glycosyltransferase involved in cell wall biosynthesis